MIKIKSAAGIFLAFFFLIHCNANEIKTSEKNYELHVASKQKAVLILFPCFPCNAENTKSEAKFLRDIENEGVTTLLLNYNMKLYLSESEKEEYSKELNMIFDQNKIAKENIFMGGFSSGGNLALLLSNHLIKTKNSLQPKGLFVIDSPLDLERLYSEALDDIEKNISEEAVEEGNYLVQLFSHEIGNPKENIESYKKLSPYLISCDSKVNIEYLKNVKIRFYCEPDLEWYLANKNRTYEELNAFHLEKAYNSLLKLGAEKAEFIKTSNRGIDANGNKKPHSWNLAERENLLKWILN
ncbi:alpha/beta hydrolase fold domain-containing protein [Flavobacterium sp. HTF]|uniref:alpha/beta hydrolase fold domain-containing protein n=1 Tax=Flavobacterium sp. HTF TaxID=2170732 RepID=UPI000D5C74D5|nr:alpha/beta hydrolase fold domain-containing protein [Flavobacterium sp. HTF]PWB21998.1 hypothetical protein DCO46_18310 [Flavobacterium sp. HTF]